MKKKETGSSDRSRGDRLSPEEPIEEITVDAYGDDEKLWARLQALEDQVAVPCDAQVIGEPVSVIELDYDGNERRGLTVKRRREDGSEHVVAASDVVLPSRTEGAPLSSGVPALALHDVSLASPSRPESRDEA